MSELQKATRLGLRYLTIRPRSRFEVEAYLEKKGFSKTLTQQVIDYLSDYNYLNDDAFCKSYLEYQTRNKPKSVFALKYDLKKKGVDPRIIDKYIESVDNLNMAVSAVKKKVSQWRNFDEAKLKKKIFNYLGYRGFSYDICQNVLERFKNEDL